MSGIRSSVAAIALACVSIMTVAQGSAGDPLGVGRQMLAEDNPGELWIDKGKNLFYEKRGPKKASLAVRLRHGSGKLEGARPGTRATSPTPTRCRTWSRGC